MAMTSVSAEEVIDDDESWFMERFYRDSHGRGMTVTSATTKREQKIMWSGIQSCDVPVPVKQGHGEAWWSVCTCVCRGGGGGGGCWGGGCVCVCVCVCVYV